MRNKLILLFMLFGLAAPVTAQVSIGIGLPNVSIGINLHSYPQLVPVPGYPVYYAPQLRSNYFFYDGLYWIYQDDRWYASTWYNGPWGIVAPEVVPVFVLRIPVRYYRRPPAFFRGWQPDAPPRWGQHWGNEWEQRRGGWDRWERSSAPAPAPLPVYQRKYSGDRYPQLERQQELQGRNYRYQPNDPAVREHYDTRRMQSAQQTRKGQENAQRPPARQAPPQMRSPSVQQQSQQGPQRATQPQQRAAQPEQRAAQPQQRAAQAQQRAPETRRGEKGSQGKGAPQESQRGQGPSQKKDGEKADDRGADRK